MPAGQKIKVGDTVRLNSGGPVMTIQRQDYVHAECVWFDNEYRVKTAVFPLGTLTLSAR